MNAAVKECLGDTGAILNCTHLPDTLYYMQSFPYSKERGGGKAGDVVYLVECLPSILEALDFMFRTS